MKGLQVIVGRDLVTASEDFLAGMSLWSVILFNERRRVNPNGQGFYGNKCNWANEQEVHLHLVVESVDVGMFRSKMFICFCFEFLKK